MRGAPGREGRNKLVRAAPFPDPSARLSESATDANPIADPWYRQVVSPDEGELETLCGCVKRLQHDALTGLPNRVLFDDRLTVATERTRRPERGAKMLGRARHEVFHPNPREVGSG